MAVGVSNAMQDEPMSIPEIIGHLQDVAQKWERILYSSGGGLKLRKCFWYLVYWEWVDGHPQMMPLISRSLAMISLTKSHIPGYMVIKRKETWEAMCTLGVRVAPDGNYRKEAQFLWTKANTFAAHLLTLNLNRMDTFIFHRSTYTPAMTYSICLMTLSRTQLNKIQSKAISAILDKLGVNHHFPRRTAFGPKELCGMSLFIWMRLVCCIHFEKVSLHSIGSEFW